MRKLSLGEIQQVREMTTPERLKQCGVSYAMALTYFPVLCDMAEEQTRAQAVAFHNGGRIRYSLTCSAGSYGIEGSDGFKVIVGSDRGICESLLGRLNAL
jgi:hypothetical protein